MKNFDLIVFDWDGTLVDSTAHIAKSIQNAYADNDLPVPNETAAKHVIGLGLVDTFNYLSPDLTKEQHLGIVDRYRHHFLDADKTIHSFKHVTEGLQNLVDRNYLLAVATGKSREGLDRALTKVDFGHMFSITRCGDEGFPKPNPDMLNFIMDDLGVFPDRTLMIGDTTHDLLLAHNAKTKSIGVTYGAHEKNKLAALNPLACVDSFEELMAWLLENG
ncbi:MAG: HAD-IA family hydrolase [Betaproteobacteria bacterium]|nr:HAD-IA family hydrolase [Betaproteobacteria bacterium]